MGKLCRMMAAEVFAEHNLLVFLLRQELIQPDARSAVTRSTDDRRL